MNRIVADMAAYGGVTDIAASNAVQPHAQRCGKMVDAGAVLHHLTAVIFQIIAYGVEGQIAADILPLTVNVFFQRKAFTVHGVAVAVILQKYRDGIGSNRVGFLGHGDGDTVFRDTPDSLRLMGNLMGIGRQPGLGQFKFDAIREIHGVGQRGKGGPDRLIITRFSTSSIPQELNFRYALGWAVIH